MNTLRSTGDNRSNAGHRTTRLAIVEHGVSAMRLVHAVRELNSRRDEPVRIIAVCAPSQEHSLFSRSCDEIITSETMRHAFERNHLRPAGREDTEALVSDLADKLTTAEVGHIWLGDLAPELRSALADACARIDATVLNTTPDVMVDAPGPQSFPTNKPNEGEHRRRIDVVTTRADDGTARVIAMTDTTIRRGDKEILIESGEVQISLGVIERIKAKAIESIDGFVGNATVGITFLVGDPDNVEVCAGSWVELTHIVAEMTTGTDLAAIAIGESLERPPDDSANTSTRSQVIGELMGRIRRYQRPNPLDASARGHAVGVVIRAEDPARGFSPTPGTLEHLRLPTGNGIRVDVACAEGDLIDANSEIAMVCAWGLNRDEAFTRLRRALEDLMIVVSDGTTNQGFLLDLLDREDVRLGRATTTWVSDQERSMSFTTKRHANTAMVAAAVEVALEKEALDQARFYGWARRGRPQVDRNLGHTVELRHRDSAYVFNLWRLGPTRWRVVVDGTSFEFDLERVNRHERRMQIRSTAHRIVTWTQGPDLLVSVDGVSHRVTRDDVGLVRSPAPAVVVAVPVVAGDRVNAGDAVAVVETMKIETVLRAPFSGRVRQILVGSNVQVDSGTPLVELEPTRDRNGITASERLDFSPFVNETRTTGTGSHISEWVNPYQLAEWMLLGFDVPDDDIAEIVTGLRIDERGPATDDPGGRDPRRVELSVQRNLDAQNRILRLFSHLRALRRPRDFGDDDDHGRGTNEYLHEFLRSFDTEAEGLPARYVDVLQRLMSDHGIPGLERTPELEDAMFRVYRSLQREEPGRSMVLAILTRRLEQAEYLVEATDPTFRELLDLLIDTTQVRDPVVADLARQVRYRYFDQPLLDAARQNIYAAIEPHISALGGPLPELERDRHIAALVNCSQHLAALLGARIPNANDIHKAALTEVMARRYYRTCDLTPFNSDRLSVGARGDGPQESATEIELLSSTYRRDNVVHRVVVAFVDLSDVERVAGAIATRIDSPTETGPPGGSPSGSPGGSAGGSAGSEQVEVDLYAQNVDGLAPEELADQLGSSIAAAQFPPSTARITVVAARQSTVSGTYPVDFFTFEPASSRDVSLEGASSEGASSEGAPPVRMVENRALRGMHPMLAERLHFWRLSNFALERLPAAEEVHLYHAKAKENPKDERLFALAEVRDLMPVHDATGKVIALPELELVLSRAVEGIRRFQALRPPTRRLQWNRILLNVWPPVELEPDEIRDVATRVARGMGGLGIEMTMMHGRLRDPFDGALHERVLRISSPIGSGVHIELSDPPATPLVPLDEYTRKVVRARSRGNIYPYELINVVTPPSPAAGLPPGEFIEHDLDEAGDLVAVDRPRGRNEAGIVVGITRNFTDRYPEGMTRVALFGDPTRALGAISQPECRRIMAALDMAEKMGVPIEWFALSAGAKIAMDSGTENMDGVAVVLRRIIEFTQSGGEINIIVTGINVGAQPYWNAEATMLMHTRGILVMTPQSAMVLTGKQALEYSGGVSADDNFGIGGYERIMGPNGQAQYWASDITSACRTLLNHYEHTYVAPGERFPRRAPTEDPSTRDISTYPHELDGSDFEKIGDIFSPEENPDRKKSFDIRTLMRACSDQDHTTSERWADMRGASTAVVWDAHLGGWPVMMIGIESHIVPRHGPVPADGPHLWSAGTLFPQSSKKVARAINATSGNRPLVVLANLSGFDGSPESLRLLQLEYGAEIGRAIVNFDGPIVFCVVSRFHGGAFVVFSRWLNDDLEAAAIEGSRASVIGGAPAAAVVFSQEVESRTHADARLADIDTLIASATDAEQEQLLVERDGLVAEIRAEKLGELADEFDAVHSVERALDVGSIDEIIKPTAIRPYLIDAVERGIRRSLDRLDQQE